MSWSEVRIRRADASDVSVLAANNRAMALETENKVLDERTVVLGTTAVVSDATKGFYLVAEREGDLVGQLLITTEWSDWRNGTFWWIQSVYVLAAARRTGVYRRLYEHVLAEARATPSVCGVRLYVDSGNVTAQAAYRSLGMRRAHYELFEVDFVLG